jgi:hypothetical protein
MGDGAKIAVRRSRGGRARESELGIAGDGYGHCRFSGTYERSGRERKGA